MDLVKQSGKDILERRKFKRPADFETLEDLEFLDDDALRAAFGQLETLDQAVVVRGARADISDRLAGTLSQRMRDIVQKAASGLERLDDVKLRILERKLIDLIKAADAAGSRADAGGAA